MNNRKQEGQYMTPKKAVDIVLDSISYSGITILDKIIIEPSFGSGAFLLKIAERIVLAGKEAGLSTDQIAAQLNDCIYGIEKDEKLYRKAISRLNNFLKAQKLPAIKWDNFICGDTLLLYKEYEGKADYVVGNPPFVNVCAIPESRREKLKEFRFSKGKLEMYILFYEVCISMLNKDGKLGFISPNTFFRNTYHQDFRNYLIEENLISAIYDFKNFKIFPEADTYTCICVLDKNAGDTIKCREYDDYEKMREYSYKRYIFSSVYLKQSWDLCSEEDREFLNANKRIAVKLRDISCTKNGLATQRDDIYVIKPFMDADCTVPCTGIISDRDMQVYFKDKKGALRRIESKILRRVVKGSRFTGTHEGDYIIFPYKEEGKGFVPIPEDFLKHFYVLAYDYLLSFKEELLKRDKDVNAEWYYYGRNQGLKDSNQEKLVFKHIIGEGEKVIPYILDKDIVIYAGYYTVPNETYGNLSWAKEAIASEEFTRYCRLLGKDMSGGYKVIYSGTASDFGVLPF